MKSEKPPPRNHVAELRRLLAGPAVLLLCAGKKPVGEWGRLTVEDMTPDYLARLRGGNIGVALGRASGGLCVVDLDQDEFVPPFLELNPALAETFQTVGRRGRSIWMRFGGRYPDSCKLKSERGDAVGEFRSHGNQSIAWGTHPETKRPYLWLVRKPVVGIEFDSIRWPDGLAARFRSDLLPEGELSKGDVSNGGPPYNCLDGVGVGAEAVLPGSASGPDEATKAAMDRAVEFGLKATRQNNAASFRACHALIGLRDAEDLSGLTRAERGYFAERWWDAIRKAGRATKPKTHYLNDIFCSIKNAKRKENMNGKNPVPEAWMLAQSKPMPPEASRFEGDERMQRLISLCYQLHLLSGKAEWFLSRNKAAELMGLDATETRDLSENFNVLVECGILEIVAPHEKGKRQATVYRYAEAGPR